MSVLEQLNNVCDSLGIPVETGVFSDTPPARYIVLTPLVDSFEEFADNEPQAEVNEVRISLFNAGNYVEIKDTIVSALIDAGFTITDRHYVGFDQDTGFHNYAIDVAKENYLDKEGA